MLSFTGVHHYFLYREKTDMRKGIDGLCGLVRDGLKRDPLSGDIFIFFNHRRNQVKLLLWERDGFSIYYKRLERGTYELPLIDEKTMSVELGNEELMLILQGICLSSVRRRKRFHFSENKFAKTPPISG